MHLFKKITLVFIAFVIAFCALVWLLSPWLVRAFTADSLAQHNLTMTPASTVRLNLFISRLTVSDVALEQKNQTTLKVATLQVDYSLWRLIKKEVHIQRVLLNGVNLQVTKAEQQLNVAGFNTSQNSDATAQTTAPKAKPATEAGVFDSLAFFVPVVNINDITVNLLNDDNPHKLHIDSLTLKDAQFVEEVLSVNVALRSIVDGAVISTQGDVTFSPVDSSLQLALTLEGFQPAPYQYLLPSRINKLDALLDAAVDLNVSIKEQRLSLNTGAISVNLTKVNAAETVYTATLDAFKLAITDLTGTFNLQSHALQAQTNINTQVDTLHVGLADNAATLLDLQALNSGDTKFSLDFSEKSNVLNYEFKSEQLTLDGLTASKARDELAALLVMDQLHVNDIHITPALMSLDTIELGKTQVDVNFDKDGKLISLIDSALLATNTETTPENTTETTNEVASSTTNTAKTSVDTNAPATEVVTTASPRILVQKLLLTEPLTIAIVDRRHSHVFDKSFTLTQLNIGPVDSANIEGKTQLTANVKDSEYFTGELAGWIQPFAKKVNADTTLTLREFPLHEVAPYLKDSLGFEVKAGQLDLDLKGTVTDDQLNSKSVAFMRGTEFGASEKANKNNLIGQTAIPLNVALNMLKDDQGNIKLTIPVKGNIHDPSFGVHYVVGLVMKKVVMSQAKSYLMNMFVPYAQVVSVAMSAGSYALKVRFTDLPYTANQVEVSDEQQTFITQMTALLKDKKDLQVQVCPVAVLSELTDFTGNTINSEQHAELLKIAEKRAQAFKAHLVKVGNIESSRLLLCSPSVDQKAGAVARIEFET